MAHGKYINKGSTFCYRKAFATIVAVAAIYACLFVGIDDEGVQSMRFTSAAEKEPTTSSGEGCDNGFFSVVAPWAGEGGPGCDEILGNDKYNKLIVLNQHMEQFGTDLTLYISLSQKQKGNPGCYGEILPSQLKLDRIKIEDYNVRELMGRYDFDENDLERLQNLNFKESKSDVIRLALAIENRQTFIDLAITFISEDYDDFKIPFVSLSVWGESSHSLKMMNSAFCLPKPVLRSSLEQTRQIMEKHDGKRFSFDELGSSLFQKTVMNWEDHPLSMYTINHPWSSDFPAIVGQHEKYNFKFLHLTSEILMSHVSYVNAVNEIRNDLGLKILSGKSFSQYDITVPSE